MSQQCCTSRKSDAGWQGRQVNMRSHTEFVLLDNGVEPVASDGSAAQQCKLLELDFHNWV
jgi:hypothetical protein